MFLDVTKNVTGHVTEGKKAQERRNEILRLNIISPKSHMIILPIFFIFLVWLYQETSIFSELTANSQEMVMILVANG